MPYFLNLIYAAILIAALPWLLWSAIFKGKYRAGFAAKFLGRVPRRETNRPCIWLHAVSVGEVNLLATLLAEIERRRPDVECVISTTTQAGLALARKKYAPRTVFYCPLDFSWAVRAAMRAIRPDVLLLAELELWPNLIRAAKEHGVRVAVVNGRLSQRSFRGYRRIGWLVRQVLSQIDLIAAQNEEYAQRFRALGRVGRVFQTRPPALMRLDDSTFPTVRVTGSLKFDGAQTDRGNPKTRELASLAGIAEGDVVFLAGSTQAPEEELALSAFRELKQEHPRLKLILVPRHPERFEAVAQLLHRSGLPWQRRTHLAETGGSPKSPFQSETAGQTGTGEPPVILLVDSIGELGAWWGTAKIAFVGGSLGRRGGQNMIEPAAYGAAVCFGPNTWNFRDVVQLLLAADAARVVADGPSLASFIRRCLDDPIFAENLGQRARWLVESQLGATARTADLLEPLLPAPPGQLRAA